MLKTRKYVSCTLCLILLLSLLIPGLNALATGDEAHDHSPEAEAAATEAEAPAETASGAETGEPAENALPEAEPAGEEPAAAEPTETAADPESARAEGTRGGCPYFGTHTYVGQSCTTRGECACGATIPALGHSYYSTLYSDAGHPHQCFYMCRRCYYHDYQENQFEPKDHGSGTWGSGTCPYCGFCTFDGQSCTSPGVCACGATIPPLGHNCNGYYYSDYEHPHQDYGYCSRCGIRMYDPDPEHHAEKNHGASLTSTTCPYCGDHSYTDLNDPDDPGVKYCSCGVRIRNWSYYNYDSYNDKLYFEYYYSPDFPYATLTDNAVAVWNGQRPGMITKASDYEPGIVIIEDCYEVSDVLGRTLNPQRKIELNKYKLSGDDGMPAFTNNEKTKVILHELGHALGLAHNPNAGNIMRQGRFAMTTLSAEDIKYFQAAYAWHRDFLISN